MYDTYNSDTLPCVLILYAAGDLVEWCFYGTGTTDKARAKQGPRRVGVQVASVSSPKIIGRALSVKNASKQPDHKTIPLLVSDIYHCLLRSFPRTARLSM